VPEHELMGRKLTLLQNNMKVNYIASMQDRLQSSRTGRRYRNQFSSLRLHAIIR